MLARRMCRRQVDGRSECVVYTVVCVWSGKRESQNYFLVLNGVTEEKVIMGVRQQVPFPL